MGSFNAEEAQILEAEWRERGSSAFVPARCTVNGIEPPAVGAECMGTFTLHSPVQFHLRNFSNTSDLTPLYFQSRSGQMTRKEHEALVHLGQMELQQYESSHNLRRVANRTGKALTKAFVREIKQIMENCMMIDVA